MMPAREVLDENRTNWRSSLNSRLATHCLGALLDKGLPEEQTQKQTKHQQQAKHRDLARR